MGESKIDQRIFEQIFEKNKVSAEIYLHSSKEKSTNHDKFRDTGYTKTTQNALFIDVLTKPLAPNSLIIREVGLVETGAIQAICTSDDAEGLKLAERIIIKGIDYTPRIKALGGKFQQFDLAFIGYTKVLLFRLIK